MTDLYVGIDIGSGAHQVQICSEERRCLRRLRLEHSLRAIAPFIDGLKELQGEQGGEVIIGMEGSNGYASPMDRLLVQAGFRVVAINSVAMDKYRQLVGQPRKDDPYDAGLISAYLIDLYAHKGVRAHTQQIDHPGQASWGKLRVFTRHYRTTKRELTRVVHRLRKHLLGYFPDLLEPFDDLTSQRARVLLTHFATVGKIQRTPAAAIARLRQSPSRRVGPKIAHRLKELALAIPHPDPMEDAMAQITRQLVSQSEALLHQLEWLQEQITQQGTSLPAIGQVATQIPGAGPVSSAELAAEIGSIHRFATRDKLSLYCGIGALNASSGKKVGARKPLQVNHRAKAAICMMAQAAIVHDERSRTYYDKKRAEGKSHWHALKCLSKYLLRKIFRILKQTEALTMTLQAA